MTGWRGDDGGWGMMGGSRNDEGWWRQWRVDSGDQLWGVCGTPQPGEWPAQEPLGSLSGQAIGYLQ